MARPNQEAINTFMSVTGVAEDVALQKIEEHGGDLNAAVNAHFSEGDTSTMHGSSVAAPQDDLMDIDNPIEAAPRRDPLSIQSEARTMNPFALLDPNFRRSLFDNPIEAAPRRDPLSIQSEARTMNPYALLDPNFRRSLFDGGSDFTNRAPFVSQPREVREIPIEVKDGGADASSHLGHAPVVEDVTGTEHAQGPATHGTVIVEDEDDDEIAADPTTQAVQQNERKGDVFSDGSREGHSGPTAPPFDSLPDHTNDIEEEMVRAAIEASKWEAQDLSDTGPQQRESHLEDAELEHVVSLSLKTAEQEKALREQRQKIGSSEMEGKPADVELEKIVASNGRPETGSSSFPDEAEEVEEQPLVRHRSRRTSSGSMESAKEVGVVEASPPSSPGHNNIGSPPLHNGNAFPSDEWGGISSEEHDEAVMLEAAMFGGIPEGTGYRFAYAPHQFMQTEGPYPRQAPRPPSPSLQAQRLIREQQDDEYLASLAADREKEMKAMEEAEAHRLQEAAARTAALEEERQKEEESRRKLEEEQEFKRQLAAKEASLPQEPASDDENAVTLLVRMPDGTRRGRRFYKSDNLRALFDFIDIGRVVKPGTYRLVRPYPRRAFSDGESALTLNELGLTSKQEALFLELI